MPVSRRVAETVSKEAHWIKSYACIEGYLRVHCETTYISVTAAPCQRHSLQVKWDNWGIRTRPGLHQKSSISGWLQEG